MQAHGGQVVGLGEALIDIHLDMESAEGRETLGGAPLNFAYHAGQLLKPHGGQGIVASRVNPNDRFGRRVLEEMERLQLNVEYMQQDAHRRTGIVPVWHVGAKLDEVRYHIVENVAFDALEFTPQWQMLASTCQAVCFGSIAQRTLQGCETVRSFVAAAPQALCVYDVNLRGPLNASLFEASTRLCSILKLNLEELHTVSQEFGLSTEPAQAAEQLLRKYGLQWVIVTRAAAGVLLVGEDVYDAGPAPQVAKPEPVGAGDACTAAVVTGLLLGHEPSLIVRFANRLGSFVATVPEATPVLPEWARAYEV